MDTSRFHTKEGRLVKSFGASESFVSNSDDLLGMHGLKILLNGLQTYLTTNFALPVRQEARSSFPKMTKKQQFAFLVRSPKQRSKVFP